MFFTSCLHFPNELNEFRAFSLFLFLIRLVDIHTSLWMQYYILLWITHKRRVAHNQNLKHDQRYWKKNGGPILFTGSNYLDGEKVCCTALHHLCYSLIYKILCYTHTHTKFESSPLSVRWKHSSWFLCDSRVLHICHLNYWRWISLRPRI